jgi:hypothetical protein
MTVMRGTRSSASLVILAAAGLGFGAGPAQGQESKEPPRTQPTPSQGEKALAPEGQPETGFGEGAGPPAAERRRAPTARVSLNALATFRADLEDRGDVAVTRAGVDFDVSFPIGQRSEFSLSFDNELSWYDFEDAVGFVPGTTIDSPVEDTYEHQIGMRFSTQMDEHWGWFVGGDVNFAGERGASWSDSATFGGVAGFTYAVSETFLIGAGVAVHTRLEDDAWVLPAVIINWRIADHWRFHTMSPALGNTGRAAILEYAPSEEWAFSIGAGFTSSDYRLEEHANTPIDEGILRDQRLPVFAGVRWSPSAHVSIDLKAGVYVWQEYQIDDRGGNELNTVETDAAPGVSLAVVFTF